MLHGEPPAPQLIAYARAFLMLNRPEIRFYFMGDDGWRSVLMERNSLDIARDGVATVYVGNATLPSGMTKREIEILTLVAGGLSNAEIADRFGTSPRTVSTQIERLMRKLDIHARAGLASVAVDGNLLALPIPGGAQSLVAVGPIALERFAHSLEREKYGDLGGVEMPTQSRHTRNFVVGTIAGLEGYSLSDAVEHVRGLNLAVDEINAGGGVSGRAVEIFAVTANLEDPSTVREAMGKLVAAGVDAIACSYVSAENPFLLDLAADYGRPFLHLDTFHQHSQLVADAPARYEAIFQTCPTERVYSLAFQRFLRELHEFCPTEVGEKRMGFIEMDVPSAAIVDDSVLETARELGWDTAMRIKTPLVDVAWSDIVDEILSQRLDFVMVSHFALPEVVKFHRELQGRGYAGLVYYVYTAAHPGFLYELGPLADGAIWSSVTIQTESALTEKFRRDYVLRYATEPGPALASAAFDQMQLLAWCWRQPGGSDPKIAIKSLRQTLHRGLNGTYFFGSRTQTPLSYPDETNDPTLGLPLFTSQIQQGKSVVLSPALFGSMKRIQIRHGAAHK